jgi:hypothetical protein
MIRGHYRFFLGNVKVQGAAMGNFKGYRGMGKCSHYYYTTTSPNHDVFVVVVCFGYAKYSRGSA